MNDECVIFPQIFFLLFKVSYFYLVYNRGFFNDSKLARKNNVNDIIFFC